MKKIRIKNSEKEIQVGKIVCVGRNYVKHAEELGNEVPEFPIIFLKPASVLSYSGDDLIYPDYSEEMHHEVELVLLIGKNIKDASDSEAASAIAAYAVGLDMTLRDIQSELKKKGHPWTLAKVFDGSAIVSDFIGKNDYSLTNNEKISLKLNGELKQNSLLSYMIFSPVDIVKYISQKMTLEEGDLIFTGTPEGVGKVNRGDKVYAEIENVGKLEVEIK